VVALENNNNIQLAVLVADPIVFGCSMNISPKIGDVFVLYTITTLKLLGQK
jgi:hypothetical protein